MAEYLIKDTTLTEIADAIRVKTGKTDLLTPNTMVSDLNNIIERSSSDLITNEATITVPAGNYKTQASKSVAIAEQAIPEITIDSAGKITATAAQTAGYVVEGNKIGTKQLITKAADTIIPNNNDQTIAAGTYLTGIQTIVGDANLIASNIVKGTSIFGVDGGYEGVELNFKVVKYNTVEELLVDAPMENTIGIITDTEITDWSFMYEALENPSQGSVWIKTNVSSDLKFNALKINKIEVSPISAKQYIDGRFVAKEIKIYQNGIWNDFGILELGLVKSLWNSMPNMKASTNYEGTETNLTFRDSRSATGKWNSGIYYLYPIDLGSYSNINITLTGNVWANGTYGSVHMTAGVTQDINITSPTSFAKYEQFTNYSGTLVIDVSDLSGEYYLGFGIYINDYTGASMDITNITFTA